MTSRSTIEREIVSLVLAQVAQLAEALGREPSCCGFDSRSEHVPKRGFESLQQASKQVAPRKTDSDGLRETRPGFDKGTID